MIAVKTRLDQNYATIKLHKNNSCVDANLIENLMTLQPTIIIPDRTKKKSIFNACQEW